MAASNATSAPPGRRREELIASHAARQHGVVTRQQLQHAGLTRSAITRRIDSGRLRPLHPGVYLTTPVPLPRTREMAAVLASGRGAVVSHFSAAALSGLKVRAAEGTTVHVSGIRNQGRRRGIHFHRILRLDADDSTLLDGIPLTTPARTLLDLAALVARAELERLVASAEREGLTTREALAAQVARNPRRRGVGVLRSVLELPGGPALTRSAAEQKFLALVRAAELPAPECNVGVGPYELDFLWRRVGLAVEVDGFRYHGAREHFEADRRRDADLLAGGVTVLRLSWRQLTEKPFATTARLAQALARAGTGK